MTRKDKKIKLNTNPATQQKPSRASWLGRFHSLTEGNTHAYTPLNPHRRNSSVEKPATGNSLLHRNLLIAFVTFGVFLPPRSPRTRRLTTSGWVLLVQYCSLSNGDSLGALGRRERGGSQELLTAVMGFGYTGFYTAWRTS